MIREKAARFATCFGVATTFFTLMTASNRVEAVAYCSLRDPVSAIQEFFPNMTDYRSLLGSVEVNVRERLTSELSYDMHFNEFGKHTLYLVYSGQAPIGLVQARSEKGDWGLDEIAWALDVEMRIRDFRYQRSRSRGRDEIEQQRFKNELIGKDFQALKTMLTEDGKRLVNPPEHLSQEARVLAATVIRSALKTILVTETVWGNTADVQLFLPKSGSS
mgnify:CR=1 FL=1